jgi:hypothetical protein
MVLRWELKLRIDVLSLGHELVIILRRYCEAAKVFITGATVAEVLGPEDSCFVLTLARHLDEGGSANSANVQLLIVDRGLVDVAFLVDGDDVRLAWQALGQAVVTVEVDGS